MGRNAWGSLLIGVALGFLMRHWIQGKVSAVS